MRHVVRIVLGLLSLFVALMISGALLISGILGLATVPEDYAASQDLVKAFLYWLLDQEAGVASPLLALGLLVVGMFLLLYEWSHVEDARFVKSAGRHVDPKTGYEPLQEAKAHVDAPESPVGVKRSTETSEDQKPTRYVGPTAAELLDEQERRKAFRALEDLLRYADNARCGLETVISQMLSLITSDDQPQSRALRFFVERALYGVYRQSCKAAIRKAADALKNRQLEYLCESIIELISAYSQGQQYLAMLISYANLEPSSAGSYQSWEEREEEYVNCARAISELPVLRHSLNPSLSMVQTFLERDPATMLN